MGKHRRTFTREFKIDFPKWGRVPNPQARPSKSRRRLALFIAEHPFWSGPSHTYEDHSHSRQQRD